MKKNITNIKIIVIFLVLVLIGGIISFNVFFTTISGVHLRSGINVLEKKAGSQEKVEVIQARRGTIRDRNGSAIAQKTAIHIRSLQFWIKIVKVTMLMWKIGSLPLKHWHRF